MSEVPEPASMPNEEELLELCLDLQEEQQLDELERLCRAWPQLAEGLRRRYAALARHGLVSLPFAPGMRFGSYRLLSEIGRGGMGIVYLAEHVSLQRRVALKLLSPALLGSERAAARFQREIEALAKIDDPGVCPIYEAGEVYGQPFLAMRYVAGRTLASVIGDARAAGAPLPIAQVVTWIAQAALAVERAHAAGLVHRDLKPANLVIGDDGRPVVLDFGLAARIDGQDPGLTASHEPIGTPAYMAPEQARGGAIGPWTDVHALGVLLFEALTLASPFPGVQRDEVLQRIATEAPPGVRLLRRDVPRDLGLVVATCLDKEPKRRYPTAEALAKDLHCVLEHRPIAARRLPAWLLACRWSQRNKVAATLIVALSLIAAAVGTAAWRVSLERDATRFAALLLASEKASIRDSQLAGLLALAACRLDPGNVEAVAHLQRVLFEAHEEWILRDSEVGQLQIGALDAERCVWLGSEGQVLLGKRADRFVPRELERIPKARVAALAPDGRCAIGTGDGRVEFLDAHGARLPVSARLGERRVQSLAWLGEHRLLATGMEGARLFAAESGAEIPVAWPWGEVLDRSCHTAQLSADGRTLVIAAPAKIWVFEVGAGIPALVQELPGVGGPFPALALNANGTRLLVASTNTQPLLWWGPPVTAGQPRLWVKQEAGWVVAELPGHDAAISHVAISRDGSRVATATQLGTVRLFDGDGAFLRERPTEHGVFVSGLDWSPSGDRLAVASLRGAIDVLTRDGVPLRELRGKGFMDVRFTADGAGLLSSGAGIVGLHRLETPELPRLRDGAGLYFARSAGATSYLTFGRSGAALLWAGGKQVQEFRDPQVESGWLHHGSREADGSLLVGGQDCRVRRFGADGKVLARSKELGGFVWRLLPLRDGRCVAISQRGRAGAVILSPDLQQVTDIAGSPASCAGGLSEDGRWLVVGGINTHCVAVFDLGVTPPLLRWQSEPIDQAWRLHGVGIDPTGNAVVAGTGNGVVHRFDLRDHPRHVDHRHWKAHEFTPIFDIDIAADGRIATASNDRTAAVWSPDGRCLARLRGHTALVTSCRFTEGGKRLLTSSEDGTARLWLLDAKDVVELALRHFRPADRRLELGEFAELIGGLLDRE